MQELSFDQLKIARQKALTNASELIEEAQFLYDHGRWARVIFLCQIAGEEIGKYLLLSSTTVCIIAGDEVNWSRFWKRLTSHREKLELVTYHEDVLLDQPFPKNLGDYFKDLTKQANDLESMKQKSLYCDFTEGVPHCPSDIMRQDLAENALKWARGRREFFSHIEESLQESNVIENMSKERIQKFRERYRLDGLFKRKKG